MKISNLCKIELYRFLHSISIIKYTFIIPLILFFMSYINIADMENEITGKLVWASVAPDFLYLIVFICAIIAIYVGREFRQRTINYEIMRGYNYCQIAWSKTITCGILISVIIVICMMAYLSIFTAAICDDYIIRILCLFILFFHICSSATMYILLFRNSVAGGVVAFFRFVVFESILQIILSDLSIGGIEMLITKSMTFNQWIKLISIEETLNMEYILLIIVAALIEYVVLQSILKLSSEVIDI